MCNRLGGLGLRHSTSCIQDFTYIRTRTHTHTLSLSLAHVLTIYVRDNIDIGLNTTTDILIYMSDYVCIRTYKKIYTETTATPVLAGKAIVASTSNAAMRSCSCLVYRHL